MGHSGGTDRHERVGTNPTQGSPDVPDILPKGSQSRIWPVSPIFNSTSSSWKPALLFLFATGRKGSLFTRILLEPSAQNTFKMRAIRDKS